MRKCLAILALLILTFSCKSQNEPKKIIGGFDISKDDKQILFTYQQNNRGSIYVMSIDGSRTKKIFESTNKYSFSNPKYSADGKTILFIENDNDNVEKNTLCISNVDGSDIKRLIKDGGIITEAHFSSNSEEIIYCRANEYNQNSPIGRKAAHDFDIYSFNLNDKKISKITNLKAYGISSIAEYNGGIIFHIEAAEKGGLYIVKEHVMKEFSPLNNPRKDKSLYYTPVVFRDNRLVAFTAPYELYLMDKTMIAKLVYRSKSSNINGLVSYNTKDQLLFTIQGELKFYSINIETKNLETINFNLPNGS